MSETIRADDYILRFIPTGSQNAVKRKTLVAMTALDDRSVRDAISKARHRIPIINLSDGDGYYIPDMNDANDRKALKSYVKQEESRLKSIGWSLKAARKTLRNCGYE